MNSHAVIAAALAAALLWLTWKTLQASKARKTARSAYFDTVAPLFDRVVSRKEPTGFPRLTAHFGPHAFDLQVVQDSLTYRKLPALWVMLTLPELLPVKATLDIMARPSGQEPFSNFSGLPQSLPCPVNLPEGSAVRSDNASLVPPEALIAPHLLAFTDPLVKELVISPKGLRLVILGEEADRGRFLIFREAELGMTPLHLHRLTPLIETLLALRQTLTEASNP